MSTLIIFSFVILIYMLPAIIASNRNHKNVNSITILNLLLGWTFLFWVISLAWAYSDNTVAVSSELPCSEEL